MKNIFLSAAIASVALVSCGTVQSIVQNTVPYTTNVLVSSGVPANQEISTTSSVVKVFGARNTETITSSICF